MIPQKPSAEQLRAARLAAGLTQSEAAAMVHLAHLYRWSEMERGLVQMDAARWELFIIKCGMHPDYRPARGVAVPEVNLG